MTSCPNLVFIERQGSEHRVHVEPGTSVMQAALDASVPGSRPLAAARLEPASNGKRDMVECVIHPRPNSRLTCQIIVTPALDGLVIRLPRLQTLEHNT